MTPADKPDLPAPSHYHPMSGEPIWDEPTVRRLLADERRKALELVAAEWELAHGFDKHGAAAHIRAYLDPKEPTT